MSVRPSLKKQESTITASGGIGENYKIIGKDRRLRQHKCGYKWNKHIFSLMMPGLPTLHAPSLPRRLVWQTQPFFFLLPSKTLISESSYKKKTKRGQGTDPLGTPLLPFHCCHRYSHLPPTRPSVGARTGDSSWGCGLVGLGTELRPLAGDGLEPSLDAGHRAAGVARLTLEEVEARVLLEDGVWRAAGVTRHIFLDVSP